MDDLITLITGAKFRPPADAILRSTPRGLPLRLEPDFDNPYDANAIKVILRPRDIPSQFHPLLEEALGGSGWDLEEVVKLDDLQLGFVASSSGKPLAKSGLTTGNAEFVRVLGRNGSRWGGRPGLVFLDFGNDGSPRIKLSMQGLKALIDDENYGVGHRALGDDPRQEDWTQDDDPGNLAGQR